MQDIAFYNISRKDAKSAGMTHYFTGKPCRKGHVSPRFVSTRTCFQCNFDSNSTQELKAYRRTYYAEKYAKNPSAHLARGKAYNDTPKGRSSTILRAMRRRVKKIGAEGSHTVEDLNSIRKQQRDRCACCATKLGGRGSLDHIVALTNGGSNWPINLQWLCRSCNSRKHTKDPIIFAQENGRLL